MVIYFYVYIYIHISVCIYIEGFEGGEEGEGEKYTPSGNQTVLKNAIYMRRDPKIQVHLHYYILTYEYLCSYINRCKHMYMKICYVFTDA
jgi:hypothetical protein